MHMHMHVRRWDALVLEGMRSTITHRRAELIKFEFNSKLGYWRLGAPERRSLSRVVRWLYECGYVCFMMAGTGACACACLHVCVRVCACVRTRM